KGWALSATGPAGLNRKELEIYRRLDVHRLPRHIAVIMDGNGRWARRRHLPRIAGHRAGITDVRQVVETGACSGLPSLTLYAFSVENWQRRPKSETGFLMGLLRQYLKQEVPTMMRNNVRLDYIGRKHELPQEVQERMAWAREETAGNSGMLLTLALNYGARSELVDAFNDIVRLAATNGGLGHLKIDEALIDKHLYTRHLPDPDLVVRRLNRRSSAASGERISGFGGWAWPCAISEKHAAVYRALLRQSGVVPRAILLALDLQTRRVRFCPGDARLPPPAAGDSH